MSTLSLFGPKNLIDHLIVHWPGADVEEFIDLKADYHDTIVQGSGEARPWSRPEGDVQFAATHNETFESGQEARI